MANNQDKIDVFVFSAGEELIIEDKPQKTKVLPDWRL